jgi:hypothetical protein
MPIGFIASGTLLKHLSIAVAAVSATLYGLDAFPGINSHAAVVRAPQAFDSSVCERPTSIIVNPLGLPEAKGATENGEAWALIFKPLRQSQPVKIVWRVTGSGRFRIAAYNSGLDGPLGPESGPNEHTASNWDRPGDEWGTVFVFPHAGCWRIEASRGNAHATFLFSVE